MFYICSGCQAFYEQPLGKFVEKVSEKSGQVNTLYRQRTGPPVGEKCSECESALHVRSGILMLKGQLRILTFLFSGVRSYVELASAQ